MRDLAPDIVRQRLLIEGLYSRDVDQAVVERYLIDIAAHLGLRTYGKPIVHSTVGVPGEAGKAENQGFDAFIPLIDSGISLYVWSQKRFFAAVLFTCKRFDVNAALRFTRDFFVATEIEHRPF
ncbi:MAG TPA: S-adenosylmethionine decarboxylase [Steroidobacteraceae bacterium]|jgi:S-adenosylmethionine decarboxylase|nr:S-adenosylmethionine decarboxylase [Steroidobacteraceae bacterium]